MTDIVVPSPRAATFAHLLARMFHIQQPFISDNGLYDLAAKLVDLANKGPKGPGVLTLVVSNRYDLSIMIDGVLVGRVQDFQFHAGLDRAGNPGVAATCYVYVTPNSGEQHVELLRSIPWIKVTENRMGFATTKSAETEGSASITAEDAPIALVATLPGENMLAMPNPTHEMQGDKLFQSIYEAIRSWDVNVPACYQGYCGANGSHAAMIYASVKRSMGELVNFQVPETLETARESLQDFADRGRQDDLDAMTKQMSKEIVEAQAASHGWPSDVQPMAEAMQFAQNWIGTAAEYAHSADYWRQRALKAEAKLCGAT